MRMRKSRNCCAQPWQLRLPEYAQIDVSAAIENLLLEADGLGLGAVWLGIAPLTERMDAVRDVLQLPEELDAFAIVPCGCPAQERAAGPLRRGTGALYPIDSETKRSTGSEEKGPFWAFFFLFPEI